MKLAYYNLIHKQIISLMNYFYYSVNNSLKLEFKDEAGKFGFQPQFFL